MATLEDMAAGPWVRGILSGLVTVALVALVGLGVFAWDRLSDGETTSIPVTTAAPQAASDCPRAQPTLFDALSAHLSTQGMEFGTKRFAVDDNDLLYLSALVGDGSGGVDATDPVWVYGGSGYAWLNDAARRVSTGLPDARAVYGADPAGPVATRVAACTTSAAG